MDVVLGSGMFFNKCPHKDRCTGVCVSACVWGESECMSSDVHLTILPACACMYGVFRLTDLYYKKEEVETRGKELYCSLREMSSYNIAPLRMMPHAGRESVENFHFTQRATTICHRSERKWKKVLTKDQMMKEAAWVWARKVHSVLFCPNWNAVIDYSRSLERAEITLTCTWTNGTDTGDTFTISLPMPKKKT